MFHLPLLLFPFSGKMGSTAGLLGLESVCDIYPLYLQGMAAYAEAAQTPSHSRILNLRQIWLKVEITLELPVGAKLIPTSIPSARVIPQIGIPLLQKTVTHSLANLTQKLSTVVKGFGLVEHICKP